MLLLNGQFHKSLFSLCHFSIVKSAHRTKSAFDIRGSGSCPIVYYKLIEAYVAEMSQSRLHEQHPNGTIKHVPALPSYLIQSLRSIQEMLLDSLWMSDTQIAEAITSSSSSTSSFYCGPSFIAMINKLRESPSSWPIPSLRELCPIKSGVKLPPSHTSSETKEGMFVGYIIQKLLVLTERRLHSLCRELSLPNVNELSLSKANEVKEKTLTLMTSLMCYRIDLFFNRHPDQIMMCALYIICSKMDLAPMVGFGEIVRVYEVERGRVLSLGVVRDILYRVKNCDGGGGGGEGDVLMFYNVSFVLLDW